MMHQTSVEMEFRVVYVRRFILVVFGDIKVHFFPIFVVSADI